MTEFVELVRLQPAGGDAFLAPMPPEGAGPQVFGGQLLAQALVAGMRTVDPDRRPLSVQAHFVRRAAMGVDVQIGVERVRDGRTFTERTVRVAQGGRDLVVVMATFHVEETGGLEHAVPLADDAGAPPPDGSVSSPTGLPGWEAFEACRLPDAPARPPLGPRLRFWVRARHPLPPDPGIHAAALLFVSDMFVGDASRLAADERSGSMTTLDHAVWFHHEPRADDWMFCDVASAGASGGRGLVLGTFHDRDGRHLATLAQGTLHRS